MAPVTRSRRVGIIAAAVVVALVAVGVVVYLSTKGSGSTSSSTQTTAEVVDPRWRRRHRGSPRLSLIHI